MGSTSIKLSNQKTGESIVVVPRYGGTVTSLVLGNGHHEILRNDSLYELERNPLFRGRFLFPFNDRIPGGKYSFKGKSYLLPVNCFEDGSAIHGFLYRERMDIAERREDKIVLTWKTDDSVLPGYPFVLLLAITITLYEGGVSFKFTIQNKGQTSAPCAFGWHSYFKTDPESILKADYPCFFKTDKSLLPFGNCCSTAETSFDFTGGTLLGGKELDHTFRTAAGGVTRLVNNAYTVKIVQKNFPYTQLFIPPERDSIAIEPITSKPNSFNSADVLILEPEEEYSAGIQVEVT